MTINWKHCCKKHSFPFLYHLQYLTFSTRTSNKCKFWARDCRSGSPWHSKGITIYAVMYQEHNQFYDVYFARSNNVFSSEEPECMTAIQGMSQRQEGSKYDADRLGRVGWSDESSYAWCKCVYILQLITHNRTKNTSDQSCHATIEPSLRSFKRICPQYEPSKWRVPLWLLIWEVAVFAIILGCFFSHLCTILHMHHLVYALCRGSYLPSIVIWLCLG